MRTSRRSPAYSLRSSRPSRRSHRTATGAAAVIAQPLERRVLLASVSGELFWDNDPANGQRDPNESVLRGASLTVYHDNNNNNVLDTGEASTTVNPDTGGYSLTFPAGTGFGNLTPTQETIRIVPPGPGIGRVSAPSNIQHEHTLTVNTLDIVLDRDFGITSTSLISGTKFNDLNYNGVRDAGEPGLSGWTIYLDYAPPGRDQNDPADATDENGNYSIVTRSGGASNLSLREAPQASWAPTAPADGRHLLTYGVGSTLTDVNFGNARTGTVQGVKFHDLDADGRRLRSEPGLAGWTIYADRDGDSAFDPGEPSDVTDADGNFEFDVFPGTFVVREVAQPGWRETTPTPAAVTVAEGQTVDLGFGNTDRRVITGTLFNDLDGDGTRDAGEGALTGWTVEVDVNEDGVVDATTQTDLLGGNYRFVLPPLTNDQPVLATVRPVAPAGWRPTVAPSRTFVLRNGILWTGIDFGYTRLAQVIGTSYHDLNRNGLRDTGEAELPGWTYYADLNDDGQLNGTEPSAVTDANGVYVLTLPASATPYRIREVAQPGWLRRNPPVGYNLILAEGQVRAGADFGHTRPTVIAAYARGSSWAGPDANPGSLTFKEYLEANSLGDDEYGYRLAADDILPWVNVDQLVLRLDGALPTSQLPATITLDGSLSDYTATPSMLDPQTVLLTLDRALGAQPGGGESGDRLRLTTNFFGEQYELRFNILQGDVGRNGTVLANDFSPVKARFFKNTNSPVTGLNDYSAYHDVDGNGTILANDYSAVKSRFFDRLPTAVPIAAAAVRWPAAPARRRGATRELFSAAPVLGWLR